jgi:IS6 family transposase
VTSKNSWLSAASTSTTSRSAGGCNGSHRWSSTRLGRVGTAATRFFEAMLAGRERPREVTTDLAAALLRVVDDLLPEALHDTTQYANYRIECDHGRLKARLRPMRGLRTDRTASIVIRGHAFIQNLRRGHYELGIEAHHEQLRRAAAFDELTSSI